MAKNENSYLREDGIAWFELMVQYFSWKRKRLFVAATAIMFSCKQNDGITPQKINQDL